MTALAPYRVRTTCRACGTTDQLRDVLDLGTHPIPDFKQVTAKAALAVPLAPLVLARCQGCGLVQLRHTVDRALLFGRGYPYRSGVNQAMADHLKDLVIDLRARSHAGEGDVVLDIGANDGTLLEAWGGDVEAFGFEPSLPLAALCRQKRLVVKPDFFSAEAFRAWGTKGAKAVTSVAMFYDVDEPLNFACQVREILGPRGVWVNEFNDLRSLIAFGAFDMVGLEHLTYWSLTGYLALLRDAGLEAFDVDWNPSNGGSLRVYAGHPRRHLVDDSVAHFLQLERDGLDVELLAAKAKHTREALRDWLDEHGQVWVYGASTRGLTTLHYCGLDTPLIVAAADRNPEKWGRYIPGTSIPITSEDEFRNLAVTGLVLPWHFRKDFIQRESKWLRDGGRFLFPLPEVELVR